MIADIINIYIFQDQTTPLVFVDNSPGGDFNGGSHSPLLLIVPLSDAITCQMDWGLWHEGQSQEAQSASQLEIEAPRAPSF